MKQKDIALIAVIIAISAVISLLVSKQLFNAATQKQQVEVVQPISSSFEKPDSRYFNKDAFDPTQQITIGQNANPDPFKDTGH
jgi:hypothetical protein